MKTHRCAIACLFIVLFHPSLSHAAIIVTDDAGQVITLKEPARRIVPLYSALGEILSAMGCGPRIAARTAADTALPRTLPSVGTHMRPNLELVAALSPDLVVQMEGREEAGESARALGRLGVAVARFRVRNFAELFSCIERLGLLTGEEEKARDLVREMRKRLEAVEKKTAALPERPSVFFEVRYPNLLGAGGDNMVDAVISAAGGRNCLEGYRQKLVRLSEETLVALNPDLYLLQQGAMNKNPLPVARRPHFRLLTAVKNDAVLTVAEDEFSHPGPRSVDAVEKLAEFILCQRNAPFGR